MKREKVQSDQVCKQCSYNIANEIRRIRTVFQVCPKCGSKLDKLIEVTGTETNTIKIRYSKLLENTP